ncbi:ABC transporter ATP-binding protein [Cryobacterium sp. TMT1-21]|uniref:ABC transporter ATP-binding protein n=1 Tax=Cryobacterium shii TaxID=1259235 RepID=A0AAQ2C3G0_9MICO|nr:MULTISPECIES: ABC transporter ATP-binding protein [Cryobacterium]TFC41740.1 ABC transporter ATP-binding protein [Cryobacterium shii]TFC88744.1 ABC transporter ATP-binding protein [Cryobacterium sp. TmT2-59]TFD12324.1 ABC transporter ATP-binding protein [Cryobacterium sp. TMT1-21]TFD16757.1 ABC transporter ATP-binding protein [Cryobacterium sp. TMT4-10]TFD42540.1 ABC transporter ATP-binding protein [Cryobacterium sp. TMT2-10]
MSSISFDGVSHAFGERMVLRDIRLNLTERRVGIVGANGSGKSTLVRLINGLITPDSGTVTVDGLNVARNAKEVRRKVGFIFTNPDNQIVMPTVAEDVAFTLRRRGLTRDEVAARTTAALDRFGLSQHADHPAHRLSGGQKQLLALAAVLVAEPQIVVADEPTTLLDARNARRITELLLGMSQQVIVVTHQLELLAAFDRVVVIEDGRVVADGTPEAALGSYRALLA